METNNIEYKNAQEIRKGDHIMIENHPCKVTEFTISKACVVKKRYKCHVIGIDIFSGNKYEALHMSDDKIMILTDTM